MIRTLINDLVSKFLPKQHVDDKGNNMPKKDVQSTMFLQDIFTMHPVGSLKVFTMERRLDNVTQIGAQENGFYWSDNNHLEGVGPFKSIWSAMEHYKYLQMERRSIKNMQVDGVTPKTAAILHVDFRTRKLIPD